MLKSLFLNEGGGIQAWVVYAVIGVVILGGGYLIYSTWSGGASGQSLKGTMMCMECGYVVDRRPTLDDMYPMTCPKCDKKGLVPADVCPHCGAMIVSNAWRKKLPPTICPKCNKEIQPPNTD